MPWFLASAIPMNLHALATSHSLSGTWADEDDEEGKPHDAGLRIAHWQRCGLTPLPLWQKTNHNIGLTRHNVLQIGDTRNNKHESIKKFHEDAKDLKPRQFDLPGFSTRLISLGAVIIWP